MLDGTYNIKVDVPIGRKDGTINLSTKGDIVSAESDAPIVGKQHLEGHAEGDTFTAEGSGKVKFMGKIDYTLKGEVSGDNLHIDISSNKGNFTLDGTRA